MSRSVGDGTGVGAHLRSRYLKSGALVVAGLVVGAVLAVLLVGSGPGPIAQSQAALICQYASNGQTAGPVEGGHQLSALASGAYSQEIEAIANLSPTGSNPKTLAVVTAGKAFGRATTAAESTVLAPNLLAACNKAGFSITTWQPGQ